jgi:antitoxin component HigA of HigAB toxin-antitoxin module
MSQNPTSDVAAEIRAELGRQDRNKAWLAAELGVSEMWVGRRLGERTAITTDDLERIAGALGVPAAQFLPASAVTA